ncbi:MAG: glycosyltransferase family 2 protein [Bacteroidia bacterium]
MELSLIIPAYNEENYISQTCNEFCSVLNDTGMSFRIIIVNDNSTDSTGQKIEAIAKQNSSVKIITHTVNSGKGASIQSALAQITDGIIILGDADMELDPKDVVRLIEPIRNGEADFVNGSRYLGTHDKKNVRTIINKIYTLFFSVLVSRRITDFACGYKAFKSSCLKNISLKEKRFCIEAELMMKACKNNLLIKEVAVSYTPRTLKQGKKLNNLDALKILFSIIKYRFTN